MRNENKAAEKRERERVLGGEKEARGRAAVFFAISWLDVSCSLAGGVCGGAFFSACGVCLAQANLT